MPPSGYSQRPNSRHIWKSMMHSYRPELPRGYDMPIRIRPWFVLFTFGIMAIIGLLGFTNVSRDIPVNHKILRFTCLGLATGAFYFIIDVEEHARRIWFWRNVNMILTGIVCFFCGGIASEIVHSLLPNKEFQFGDVFANLLGSSVGLYIAYHMERHYRRRREISRLYQPLGTVPDDISSEDDDDERMQLPTMSNPAPQGKPSATGQQQGRLKDVWDARDDLLFDIGEAEEGVGGASEGNKHGDDKEEKEEKDDADEDEEDDDDEEEEDEEEEEDDEEDEDDEDEDEDEGNNTNQRQVKPILR